MCSGVTMTRGLKAPLAEVGSTSAHGGRDQKNLSHAECPTLIARLISTAKSATSGNDYFFLLFGERIDLL